MRTVDMRDASAQLPQLVEAIERGEIDEIVIVRDGQPVARLAPLNVERRIGIAEGIFLAPEEPGADDAAVADMFLR